MFPYLRKATEKEEAIYRKVEEFLNKGYFSEAEEEEFFDIAFQLAEGDIDEEEYIVKFYASRIGINPEDILTWYYIDEDDEYED